MIVKDELGPKPDQLPLPEAAPPPDYNTTITTPSNVHADAYPFPPGSTPSTRQTPVKETSRYVYKLGDDPSLRSSLEDKPLPPPPDSDDGQLIASTSALYLRAPRSSSNLATDRSAPHHSLSVPLPTLTASSSALDLRSTPSRSNLALGRPRTHSFTPSSQTPLTASSAGFPSPFLTSPFLASPTLTPSTPGSPTPSDGTLGRSWSNMITEANRWLSGRRTGKASAEHVRTTVHQLVRELVERPDAAGAPGVLGACEGLCKSGGQALPALLRERSIEGHTPLYWAIVKFAGARGGGAAGATWLLSALAAHVRPLEGDARSDARLACVEAADNAVYQVLRGIPGFVELSGADRVLFGEQGLEPIDTVEVREDPDVPEFVATFECPLFMQRTRAGRQLQCEFLAKGAATSGIARPWLPAHVAIGGQAACSC